MDLIPSLRLAKKEVIALVGGGGKTTAMVRLAAELVTQGKRVITTTTTRLFAAQARATSGLVLRYDGTTDFTLRVQDALAAHNHLTIVGEDVEGDKVAGVPAALVDELAGLDGVDALVVEADGARMRPLKAPAAHEPVVPRSTTLLVPVVGITAIGSPLDEEHVHRPEWVARLAGARAAELITPVMVARLLAHSDGGLKGKPPAARVIVLINQVVEDAQLAQARALAHLLLGYPAMEAVAIGAVGMPQSPQSPIRETHRRVAAVVLAAGAGTRMEGRVKQLLRWQGKTFIENAVNIALTSTATESVVVLGAHAQEIRDIIRPLPVRVVLNADWAHGHSTSIRAGLGALSPATAAAIFVNADQPRLTSQVVNAIIQRYRETDAAIVAARYAGRRGSPVLFDRVHWAELGRLEGEQGGRELLSQYPVEYVDLPGPDAGYDVDTPEDYANLNRSANLERSANLNRSVNADHSGNVDN